MGTRLRARRDLALTRMRFLRSPNLMSWLALSVRLAGFAILMPLALHRLVPAEASVWLLFTTIATLQLLVDFGFSVTFSREIAYGFAGGSTLAPRRNEVDEVEPEPDWTAIARSRRAMLWIYRRLALAMLALLATAGSLAVMGPIARLPDPAGGWLGWSAVVLATSVGIFGTANSTLIVGANRVDMLKRWEVANGMAFLPLQILVLVLGGGLVGLVLVAQLGVISQALVNHGLARRITAGRVESTPASAETAAVVRGLWPAAWRTAIGSITSFGVAQAMAIIVANVLAAGEAASVQVALRIVQILSQFSQVPFYTKIPAFNRLRAQGLESELVRQAAIAMRASLAIFVASVIAVDLTVRPGLALLGSRTHFPEPLFWALLSAAYLCERIGAMHVQLLLTDNRVIAHLANSATAALWIAGTWLMWPWAGVVSLPAGMLVAYACAYTPWATILSHRVIGAAGGIKFEARTSLAPTLVLLSYFAAVGMMH
jgi:hypothetical protein